MALETTTTAPTPHAVLAIAEGADGRGSMLDDQAPKTASSTTNDEARLGNL
jgi:hypothetical protein